MKVPRRPIFHAIVLAGLIAPFHAGAEQPSICGPLSEFANSVPVGHTQTVEYAATWGAEPTWSCNSGATEAGERFCAWLMPSAAKEWVLDSVRDLLRCPAKANHVLLPGVFVGRLSGDVLLLDPVGVDSDVSVSLQFDEVSFRISVHRDAPDDDQG